MIIKALYVDNDGELEGYYERMDKLGLENAEAPEVKYIQLETAVRFNDICGYMINPDNDIIIYLDNGKDYGMYFNKDIYEKLKAKFEND